MSFRRTRLQDRRSRRLPRPHPGCLYSGPHHSRGSRLKLPDFIDDATAAAIMLNGLIVQSLLRGSYPIRAGEMVLVHAAAGGIGLLMYQWAWRLGARVVVARVREVTG
jgi:NADPH:quinone reductase-like Zn-dependent oxidoreductase